MRFLYRSLSILFLAMPATAQDFSANDVSILLEAPFQSDDLRLTLPQSSLSQDLANAIAATIAAQVDQPEGADRIPDIGTALLAPENRDRLHVASLRIDPGAPGLHSAFDPFGRNLQVRLVVQPVNMEAAQPVADEALHLIYQFGTRDDSVPGCRFRISPSQADMADFAAALADLAALRDEVANLGVSTSDAPLGVHPAFRSPEAAALLVKRLHAFVETHLTQERLSAVSIAGIPENQPEPWVFLAMQVAGPTKVIAVPSPALAGKKLTGADQQANTRQMLSFVHSRNVIPTPVTRNLAPVDCLFNQTFWQVGLPTPGPDAGVATADLFEPGRNTPERAAQVAAVIADPSRSHFFNTDCVSCHTETRRQMDAGPDPAVVGAQIAAAEGVAEANLPTDPGQSFDNWNTRAFGWYPGFRQTDARAQATVVRRTARETADVLACLNHGNWRDLSQPCVARDPVQIDSQGWSDDVRRRFYHTSQGGRILPAAWFNGLEIPGGGAWFSSSEHLESYGLLMSERDEWNPDGWPVGFARTSHEGTDYVSLNCAACHTADVVAGDVRLRVDGAPSSFDFDRFTADLRLALSETMQMRPIPDALPEPTPRFERFLTAILPETPQLRTDKASAVASILKEASAIIGALALRQPAHPSGPGRVDALTQITNVIAVSDLGIPSNFAVPSAPTSYPPLWLTDELEYVQYNLAAADPLSRNLGQALGVFGTVSLSGDDMFSTSADIDALLDYETWIAMLDVPKWPEEELGPIDEDLARTGKDLFGTHCESCHNAPDFRRTNSNENLKGDRFIRVSSVPMERVRTDPTYIRAFTTRWAQSGALAGLPLGTGQTIQAAQPAAVLLGQVVTSAARKAVEGNAPELMRLRPTGHDDCPESPEMAPCTYAPPNFGAGLKAGPLVGVWATGPYLHNGSVRTLYQLLSPPEARETTFFVGDRRIDVEEMGFLSAETDGAYPFDTRVPGNGNGGHVFWDEPFTDAQKRALIEYLKDPFRLPFDRPDEE